MFCVYSGDMITIREGSRFFKAAQLFDKTALLLIDWAPQLLIAIALVNSIRAVNDQGLVVVPAFQSIVGLILGFGFLIDRSIRKLKSSPVTSPPGKRETPPDNIRRLIFRPDSKKKAS